MKNRTISVAILASVAATLSGCGYPALERSESPMATVAQPVYGLGLNNRILPNTCMKPNVAGFGRMPPGCSRDVAFGAQVAHANDLVSPQHAGPSPSVPAAIAAYRYIYGVEPFVQRGPQDTAEPGLVTEVGPPGGEGR